MRLILARPLVTATAAISCIGEALLLFHSLADRYPDKMMSTPSFRFYEVVAYIGLVVGPTVSIAICWRLSRRALWYVCAVACALAPAVFLAILALAHMITRVDMHDSNNFDHTTPAAALGEFASKALWLIVVGSIIGAVCGTLIAIVRTRSKKPLLVP